MEKGRGKGTDTLQTDEVFTRKEYIEREAAKSKSFRYRLSNGELSPPVIFANSLDAIPAADVVPVRHATWRYITMTVPGGRGQTYAKWSCTACKAKQKERSNYCPNCGALMDKDGDGE